jgi:hypothetical protein
MPHQAWEHLPILNRRRGQPRRMREEEESEGANTTPDDKWRALAKLVQKVWDEGRIPPQLGLFITVLVPKDSGEYRGIRLLEQIWKVIERVMDHRKPSAIVLHDSLHGCRNRRGTGTAVIEAKLTQQLAHIKQSRCGASQCGTKCYPVNLSLKVIFYHFFFGKRARDVTRREPRTANHTNWQNTTTMLAELPSSPATWS